MQNSLPSWKSDRGRLATDNVLKYPFVPNFAHSLTFTPEKQSRGKHQVEVSKTKCHSLACHGEHTVHCILMRFYIPFNSHTQHRETTTIQVCDSFVWNIH